MESLIDQYDAGKGVGEGRKIVAYMNSNLNDEETEHAVETEYIETEKDKRKRKRDDEEDDIVERFQCEVDESVSDFVDEMQIGRNSIPDSSDEEEDELTARDRRIRRRRDDKLAIGSAFYTGLKFKEAVLDYALSNARNIVQERWDKTKLAFKCGMGGNCKWRVYCSYDEPKQMWLVKTTYSYHNCSPNGKCKILKSLVIARLFMDKLRRNSNFMPEEIQEAIKNQWKLVASRNQCQRGRLLALRWLDNEYAEQLAHIRGYVKEILTSNPGSRAFIETVPNAAGEDVLNRFYVCFHILKSSWRGSCRPIIGVDGTFLKVAVKGILLTAVGHDANNQIYSIAWAVVQAENADNWHWFIKQIKSDLVLGNGSGFVILSDRSKGLISAVKDELPEVEHRMCVKHIIENLKKNHAKKDLIKPLIWGLAWSYNEQAFEENLRKVRGYSLTLYNDVMKEQPKSWSRAFFRLGSYCEDVDNNATESFNSTITKTRAKAMIPMLETIRRQAMQRISKRNKKSNRHKGKFTKYVTKMLALEKEDAERCTTYPATQGIYEVVLDGNSFRINLPKKTCTCCKWQISGIPCEHAYGAMIDKGLDVEDYVSLIFSTFMWQMNYETDIIIPLRGPRFWINSGLALVVPPPEPTLPGRKKKKKQTKFSRIRGKHESPKKKKSKKKVEKLGRGGGTVHCSKCSEAGHNSAGCKKFPKMKKDTSVETAATIQPSEVIHFTQPN